METYILSSRGRRCVLAVAKTLLNQSEVGKNFAQLEHMIYLCDFVWLFHLSFQAVLMMGNYLSLQLCLALVSGLRIIKNRLRVLQSNPKQLQLWMQTHILNPAMIFVSICHTLGNLTNTEINVFPAVSPPCVVPSTFSFGCA